MTESPNKGRAKSSKKLSMHDETKPITARIRDEVGRQIVYVSSLRGQTIQLLRNKISAKFGGGSRSLDIQPEEKVDLSFTGGSFFHSDVDNATINPSGVQHYHGIHHPQYRLALPSYYPTKLRCSTDADPLILIAASPTVTKNIAVVEGNDRIPPSDQEPFEVSNWPEVITVEDLDTGRATNINVPLTSTSGNDVASNLTHVSEDAVENLKEPIFISNVLQEANASSKKKKKYETKSSEDIALLSQSYFSNIPTPKSVRPLPTRTDVWAIPKRPSNTVLISPCLETKGSIKKPILHRSETGISVGQSASSDDSLHLAVALFTKDVHRSYKHTLRSQSSEMSRPPPKKVFPHSTIIVNRFESGLPYLDLSMLKTARTEKKVEGKFATAHSSETFAVQVVRSPANTTSASGPSHSQMPPPLPMLPYLSTSLEHPLTGTMASPTLFATQLFPPQPGFYWTKRPYPSAPPAEQMRERGYFYSRGNEDELLESRSRRQFAPFLSRKMASFFPFLTMPRLQPLIDESGSQPYSQHPPPQSDMYDERSNRAYYKPERRQDCDPDDCLLQMACCCCWPFGVAAKMLVLMFPRERSVNPCVRLLAKQLSIYALLFGVAAYFFISLMFITLLLALVQRSHH